MRDLFNRGKSKLTSMIPAGMREKVAATPPPEEHQGSISAAIELKKKQLPQMDYMWRVTLPYLGASGIMDPTGKGIINSPEEVKAFLLTHPETNEIDHRVFSIDAPYREFEISKNTFGQSYFYNAMTNDVGTVSMKIDEFEDGQTLDYLDKWQSLITNRDGSNNPPVIYKRDIMLIRMSASGLDLHVTYYTACWPASISPSGFSYDSNSITQYAVTFSADGVSHKIIPAWKVIWAVDAIQEDILTHASSVEGNYNSKTNLKNSLVSLVVNKVTDFLF